MELFLGRLLGERFRWLFQFGLGLLEVLQQWGLLPFILLPVLHFFLQPQTQTAQSVNSQALPQKASLSPSMWAAVWAQKDWSFRHGMSFSITLFISYGVKLSSQQYCMSVLIGSAGSEGGVWCRGLKAKHGEKASWTIKGGKTPTTVLVLVSSSLDYQDLLQTSHKTTTVLTKK